MTFEDGLRAQVAGRSDKWSKRILAILNGPDSRLKRWFLKRAEADARLKLDLGDKVGIDWSSIDWQAILDFILKLAAIILPLILKAAPATKAKVSKRLGRTRTVKRL